MTKIKFVRVKTKKAVLIIPIREYIKGVDRENEGIPFDFIEEEKLNLLGRN
jgi:hypothetical protein